MNTAAIIPINTSLESLLRDFRTPPELGFGRVMSPIMGVVDYEDGQWKTPRIEAYGEISLPPDAKVLHYGQQVFEGMKAYSNSKGDCYLFRAFDHWCRFNQSAKRMAIPEISQEDFMDCLHSVVVHCKPHIPQGSGESLYLRPVVFGRSRGMGLEPSSSYTFLLLASPSAAYFSQGEVHVFVEREHCRAAKGGTGGIKTAGNYGGAIQSALRAKERGFHQTLWLDAEHKRYVEEFSGMNFFAIRGDELWTPELSETILPGITRDAILKLAESLDLKAVEGLMDVDQLLQEIDEGVVCEAFACGTAAVITPIAEFGESDGTRHRLRHPMGQRAQHLRQKLVNIQHGLDEDPFAWRTLCEGDKTKLRRPQ